MNRHRLILGEMLWQERDETILGAIRGRRGPIRADLIPYIAGIARLATEAHAAESLERLVERGLIRRVSMGDPQRGLFDRSETIAYEAVRVSATEEVARGN